MSSLGHSRPRIYLGSELITLCATFFVTIYFFRDFNLSKPEWNLLAGIILLCLGIEYGVGKYYSRMNEGAKQLYYYRVKTFSAFIGLIFLFYFLFSIQAPFNSRLFAIVLCFLALSFVNDFIVARFIRKVLRKKNSTKYTLVAGTGNVARIVENQLSTHKVEGYQLRGFINCNKTEECLVEQDRVVGKVKDINQYLSSNTVDEIVIALPGSFTSGIQNILSAADYHGIRVKYIIDYHEVFGRNYKLSRFGDIDAVDIRRVPLDDKYSSGIKNLFDKVFSAAALLLLSPLFLLLAILIKLESPGSVFYCPIRIGKDGKPFQVYKFRSMRVNDSSEDGVLSTQENDARITKLGNFLRKYSLDELPQFLNVLLGEMSVVGPRPHRRFLHQQLQTSVNKYMLRQYVKPGITGWAQVNGWRGPTNTAEQKRQRTLHDLWYIENWSMWLDLKIVLLTAFSKKVRHSAF